MRYIESLSLTGLDETLDIANISYSNNTLAIHIHHPPETLVKSAKFDSATVIIVIGLGKGETQEVTTFEHIMLMDILDVMDEDENVKMMLFSFESKNTSYY